MTFEINGVEYQIYQEGGSGMYVVRQWDGAVLIEEAHHSTYAKALDYVLDCANEIEAVD